MKAENSQGLGIDLIRTPFPGHIEVTVEGRGKLVVDLAYATLAEGLADAIVMFSQGQILCLTVEDVLRKTVVTAIDTEARTITIRFDYEVPFDGGKGLGLATWRL